MADTDSLKRSFLSRNLSQSSDLSEQNGSSVVSPAGQSSSSGRFPAGSYYDPSMESVTMPDGTVMNNPHKMNADELRALEGYLSGTVYLFGIGKREAEAAYNKYQMYLQWFDNAQNNALELGWNSEQSQVQRMEDAGLNPDILGVGSSTSDVSSGDYTLASPSSVPLEDPSVIFGTFENLVSAIASPASAILNVLGSIRNLKSQNISNTKSMLSDIAPLILDTLPDSFFSDFGNPSSVRDALDAVDYVAYGLDDRQVRQMKHYLSSGGWRNSYYRSQRAAQQNSEVSDKASMNGILYNPVSGYDPTSALFRVYAMLTGEVGLETLRYNQELARFQRDYQAYMNSNDAASKQASVDILGMQAQKSELDLAIYDATLKTRLKAVTDAFSKHVNAMASTGDPLMVGMATYALKAFSSSFTGTVPEAAAYMLPMLYEGYMENLDLAPNLTPWSVTATQKIQDWFLRQEQRAYEKALERKKE